MAEKTNYSKNVFINCPFDNEYLNLRNALVFAIFDCGFVPRCALEEDDSGNIRFEKIKQIIAESKLGIHDLSRTELDSENNLPRFNMPLELGLFLGAKCFGGKVQKQKNCLIFDKEQYRYQKFISDIAGQDIRSHNLQAEELIKYIRNWLNSAFNDRIIPGGKKIYQRFEQFKKNLPELCSNLYIEPEELTYNNYNDTIETWLKISQINDL